MKKELINEETISEKMIEYLYNSGLPIEQCSIFVYKITYLRLLSITTFKDIIGHNEISLETFLQEYEKKIDTIVKKDIELSVESEVHFNNFNECKAIAIEILESMKEYIYSIKNVFPLLSILCSHNGTILKNVMTLDLLKNSRNVNPTPEKLCRIINYILKINEKDEILDICSAYGNFLVNTSLLGCKNVNGIEIDKELALISKIRISSLCSNKYEVKNSNIFETVPCKKYDKVFCNFPWHIRYDKYQLDYLANITSCMKFKWDKINNISTDWLFINYLLASIKNNGKGAAIMTGGSLFRMSDEIYRKELIDNGLIESVIKIPILTTYTMVEQYLIVFSENNKKVNFIDISKTISRYGFKKIDIDTEKIFEILNFEDQSKVITLTKEEIANNKYILTVDNYIDKIEVKYNNPVDLSECVEDVFRGYQMTLKEQKELESEDGNYEILMISDIDNGIISEKLKKIKNKENKYERYILKNNDIIITSKGTKIKVAVINDINDRKIIATGNLNVIRLNINKLNPYYLEIYLNSENGKIQLERIQTGSNIISINPGKLLELKVDMLPIEKQAIIAKKYNSIKMQYLIAKEHLKKIEDEQSNFYKNEVVRMFND